MFHLFVFAILSLAWEDRLRAGGEGDHRGWDGWMASPTQWTWVWVSSRSWWWTGRPGMLQSMGWQRVGHNWAATLNWGDRSYLSIHPKSMSRHIWLMLSYRSFMVWGLTYKSFIHFQVSLAYGVRKWSGFILLHVAVQFSQNYWKDCPFSTSYSCFLCQGLIEHKSMSLSHGSLCCSSDLCVCFCASTIYYWGFFHGGSDSKESAETHV